MEAISVVEDGHVLLRSYQWHVTLPGPLPHCLCLHSIH